jgi:hypothetical protein
MALEQATGGSTVRPAASGRRGVGAAGGKRRLARRPVEQTRALMLTAAVKLLAESVDDDSDEGLAFAVSHIRVTDVVAEASRMAAAEQGGTADEFHPLSIGALYQIWPTQPEFQSELLLHLAADLGSTVYPTADTTRAHLDEGIRGATLRDLTMREAWHHSRVDPIARAMLAAYPRIANPQIRSHLADGYTSFFEQVAPAWRLILAESGRRPRPGYTEIHVARTVAAAIEGFTLQWLADPDALADPEGDEEWDLALRAIAALIDALTEPVGDATA